MINFKEFWQKSLVKNSFFMMAGNLLAGFLGYVFHFLISRRLSISAYGELQSLISLAGILAVPSAAITFFTIKHSSGYFAKNDFAGNFAFYHWLRLKVYWIISGLSVIFVLISPWLLAYLHLPSYPDLFLAWLFVAVGLLVAVKSGILSGWQDFKSISLSAVLATLIKLIVGVMLVELAATAFSALIGYLAAGIFSFIFLKSLIRKKGRLTKEAQTENKDNFFKPQLVWQEIKKIILPVLFFTFLLSLLNSLDMLMVKNLVSPELAGFYGAFNILGKIIFWASSAIVAVILPMACAQSSQKQKLDKKTLLFANLLIFAICLGGAAMYLFFPDLIISLLFGAKYLALANSLWAFALMALSLSLLSLEATLAYARYDFKISYLIAGSLILEIILVSLFHQNLLMIALMVALAQFIGYVLCLAYNLKVDKNNCVLVELPLTQPN